MNAQFNSRVDELDQPTSSSKCSYNAFRLHSVMIQDQLTLEENYQSSSY